MRKILTALWCTLLITYAANAQDQSPSFTLTGRINTDTGKIVVGLIADSSFYPKGFLRRRILIKGGIFTFKGFLPYPVGVQLESPDKGYLSGFFMLEPGNQYITVSLDSNRKVPTINNSAMREYQGPFATAFEHSSGFRAKLDSKWPKIMKKYNNKVPDSIRLQYMLDLKKAYSKYDSTLFIYVRTHPGSFLALWKLVYLSNFGYEPIFDSIYNSFSENVKQSYTGKILHQKLVSFKTLTGIDKVFPAISCVDQGNKPMPSRIFSNHKFTLVDFWYIDCAPCLAQFDGLKAIYNDFHTRGLEIVGISIDKQKYRNNWQRVIKIHNLQWPQFLDEDGKEAGRLNITAYPTNFLLDSQGKILAKDLSPVELKRFLTEQMGN